MTHPNGCRCVPCLMLDRVDVVCNLSPHCVANTGHAGPCVGVGGVLLQAVADGAGWFAAHLAGGARWFAARLEHR